ncbi:WAT1-related protein At3g28050 isoform X2 [Cajanus cajan]|uniref:WAT1-related protein At3g28050 isoform X2 n=1 Tax=Cajanus cajan TaxID=3821 RepID=UPI00098DBEB1|nr:WAT1-related protein At3g28050 isoform X2 [Cajanus cajan]
MKEVGVVAVMLTAELLDVIVNTVSKAAMKKGMNDFVFVMYSNAFAACFLFLITLIFYRKRTLPPLSYNIVGLFFVVGLISCSNQMFKFFGIGYSSPTLASALSDLIPAFTFILAIIFRMEKFVWKANSTVAKSIGTFVSISGALIMSLYKGQAVINSGPSLKLLPKKLASSMEFDWVFGAALLAAHSCFLSINYILLAIFVLSFRGVIHTWAMGKRGPVYVAMFKPLEIVFAVILGITFLGDNLYVGSVIGAAIVVIGFYAVIWGKSQEKVEEEGAVYSSESYSTEAPLLQNQRIGE